MKTLSLSIVVGETLSLYCIREKNKRRFERRSEGGSRIESETRKVGRFREERARVRDGQRGGREQQNTERDRLGGRCRERPGRGHRGHRRKPLSVLR